MRVKETADDYRLFPIDLAPFDLDDEFIDRCPDLPMPSARFEADFALRRPT